MEAKGGPQERNCDKRVVWLQPWDSSRPLSEATKQLTGYGAILSVAVSEPDRALCIIFQHAYGARTILAEQTARLNHNAQGMFGPHVDVQAGTAYPTTDDLRRMEAPFNERRRLTFARQQLFKPPTGVSEQQFRRDIYAIVGAHNVELVWLFNTGNGKLLGNSLDSPLIFASHRHILCHGHCSACARGIFTPWEATGSL